MKRFTLFVALVGLCMRAVAGPISVPPQILPYLADAHFQVPPDLRFPREISDAVNRGMVGGKRVRPLLCYLSAGTYGASPELVRELACAVEFVHNASLIHDDVIDASTQRRNEPTLWAQSTVKNAVVIGDWLMAEGVKLAARSQSTDQVASVLHTIQEMTRGEAQQAAALAAGTYSVDQWRQVADAKTGVLFAWALAAPARELHLPVEAIRLLEDLGLVLGQLFQAQDDIKDSYDERGEMNLVLWEAAQIDRSNPLGKDFSEETLAAARRRVVELLARNRDRALDKIEQIVGHSETRWKRNFLSAFPDFREPCVEALRAFAVLVSAPPAGFQ